MDAYLGEIRMFAGNYAPEYWHLCDGTKLPIKENEALFALLSTTWGGDGVNDFGLPDLCGRIPIGQGTGPGLTPRVLGKSDGSETAAVYQSQMPSHDHTMPATTAVATATTPSATTNLATLAAPAASYVKTLFDPPRPLNLSSSAITMTGAGKGHPNIMPSFAVTYIICLRGTFPQHP